MSIRQRDGELLVQFQEPSSAPSSSRWVSGLLGLASVSGLVLAQVTGRWSMLISSAILGVAVAGQEVRRRRLALRLSGFVARASGVVLLDVAGRELGSVHTAGIDQLGVGRDGQEHHTVWFQVGDERTAIMQSLSRDEARAIVRSLEQWLETPREPYR